MPDLQTTHFSCLLGLGVERPGGGEVLDYVAQGFVDGDFFVVAAAGDLS